MKNMRAHTVNREKQFLDFLLKDFLPFTKIMMDLNNFMTKCDAF